MRECLLGDSSVLTIGLVNMALECDKQGARRTKVFSVRDESEYWNVQCHFIGLSYALASSSKVVAYVLPWCLATQSCLRVSHRQEEVHPDSK